MIQNGFFRDKWRFLAVLKRKFFCEFYMHSVKIIDYKGDAAVIFSPEMMATLGNPLNGDEMHFRPIDRGFELLRVGNNTEN